MGGVVIAVGVLCGISLALAALLLLAEHFFADYGEVEIEVNAGTRRYKVKGGGPLLATLNEQKLFLPSACGGRGSCGFCRCQVRSGGGPVLPTETPYLSPAELAGNVRLACQVKVKEAIAIVVPEELLAVRDVLTTVTRIEPLTHDIKGLRFQLPAGETLRFKAGQYMQFEAPPYGEASSPTVRAYSIASSPADANAIELVIRKVPNGLVTTYVFDHLKENQPVRLIGPFGDFFLRDSDREIVFIAGGSGLAPIRSIVLDMIERKISRRRARFFFGAVGLRDLYYVEEFQRIAKAHSWFEFIPALSGKDTGHSFQAGLITDVVARHYEKLDHHEAYLCGSPGMINACVKVLTGKGLPESLVFFDKFS